MQGSFLSPASGRITDRDAAKPVLTGPKRSFAERLQGNFFVGCLIGTVLAAVLWAAIGFVIYSLL